jgi:ABC-type polar amino acid transport system ATPase subunit
VKGTKKSDARDRTMELLKRVDLSDKAKNYRS